MLFCIKFTPFLFAQKKQFIPFLLDFTVFSSSQHLLRQEKAYLTVRLFREIICEANVFDDRTVMKCASFYDSIISFLQRLHERASRSVPR